MGHTILSSSSGGYIVARRDGDLYIVGRKYDIVSRDQRGKLWQTEVKWSDDERRQKDQPNKVVRHIERALKKLAPIIGPTDTAIDVGQKLKRRAQLLDEARQLHFDIKLTSDVTMTGIGLPPGGVSLTNEELNIRYEFWSPDKHDIVIPVSEIFRITDPRTREERMRELREIILKRLEDKLSR